MTTDCQHGFLPFRIVFLPSTKFRFYNNYTYMLYDVIHITIRITKDCFDEKNDNLNCFCFFVYNTLRSSCTLFFYFWNGIEFVIELVCNNDSHLILKMKKNQFFFYYSMTFLFFIDLHISLVFIIVQSFANVSN